ncbi:response regulator transcription factor [Candidatus Dojkabacteria bacterium]|uniref:Response regulator transcription factor n=1 Tax=Candidatus Dojkabacteria bacterium TaxID=2099670 RepID=A0A847ESY5_9BACT|nr:response regulator transcription factor [Candidatus Dojkabacteria bacterium]
MADTKKILIVEDEVALLDSYSELVESAGYIPMKASDGYQALDVLSNNLDQIDLVLLDLMMPGVDGLEVLKTVKNNEEKYGKMPIIILTNMTSESVVKEAFNMGATSYLVKTDLDYEGLVKELSKFFG